MGTQAIFIIQVPVGLSFCMSRQLHALHMEVWLSHHALFLTPPHSFLGFAITIPGL